MQDEESVAADGHLDVTASQLHRRELFQGGEDLRLPVDAGPVLLA